MPQLDSLRGLAVAAVMIHHFLGHGNLVRALLPWGGLGVRLFFVLSGFLITGILLDCRGAVEAADTRPWPTLGRFYVRRFLRIFPAYYLTLAATALLDLPEVRSGLWWHAGYASNVYAVMLARWPGRASHFWSLAVEEQFYLVWPWLVLLLPRRALLPVVAGLALSAPLYRAAAVVAAGDAAHWWGLLPLGCLDSLGGGALLALAADPAYVDPRVRDRCLRLAWRIGLPALVVLRLLHVTGDDDGTPVVFVLQGLAMSLLFVSVVARAADGFRGRAGAVLDFRPLALLGTVSYAVYLFHNFVPALLDLRHRVGGVPRAVEFLVNVVVTISLATLSWRWFERPINGLKRSVPYVRPRATAAAVPVPVASRSLGT
jgi:peptidoglycan/LPS O-acetylase OafA/YrhL